jgi:pimeloyl-ACP methyl ester carboxylesterase
MNLVGQDERIPATKPCRSLSLDPDRPDCRFSLLHNSKAEPVKMTALRRFSDRRLSVCSLLTGLMCLVGNSLTIANDRPSAKRLGGDFVDHMIPVDGGELCCARREGTGPTVMLIPGTFSDSRTFGRVIPHLTQSFNLLIVENRGLGKSWPPPEDGSIEQCGRDALLIARQMKASSFYIGGHSLGGMISIEVARIAPEKLRGVISIEGWTNWHAARDAFNNDMKSTLTDEQLREKAAYRKDVLQNWSESQIKAFGQIWKKWDGESVLQTTHLPVLELYGDRGRAPASLAQLRIPKRRSIELRWFKNASHSLQDERPEQIAQAINQFVRQCEAARTEKQ